MEEGLGVGRKGKQKPTDQSGSCKGPGKGGAVKTASGGTSIPEHILSQTSAGHSGRFSQMTRSLALQSPWLMGSDWRSGHPRGANRLQGRNQKPSPISPHMGPCHHIMDLRAHPEAKIHKNYIKGGEDEEGCRDTASSWSYW